MHLTSNGNTAGLTEERANMERAESVDRRGLGLRNLLRGRMGMMCLVAAGLALSLGSPTQAHAQQARRNFVGVWTMSAVINGVPVTQILINKADGTYISRTEAPGVVLLDAGRYAYATGIATYVSSINGSVEQDHILWLYQDQFIATCLQSNVPGAVGLRLVYTRVP